MKRLLERFLHTTRYALGVRGEREAERYLERKGLRVVARRYRAAGGEIDLIMRDGDAVVFVEVKYRPRGVHGDGLNAVTPKKRDRITRAAMAYIKSCGSRKPPMRFDVVELTTDGILHMERAFTAHIQTRRTQ